MRTRNLLLCLPLLAFPLAATAQVPIPEPTPRSIAFHRELCWLWLVTQAMAHGTLGWMAFSGWGGRLAARAARTARGRPWLAVALTAGATSGLYALALMPVEVLRIHRLAPYFGQSSPELAWLVEAVIPAATLCVTLTVAGVATHWMICRSPRWWWLRAGAVFTTAATVFMFAQPLVDPAQRAYPRIEDVQASWAPRLADLGQRAGAAAVPVLIRPVRPGDFCPTQNSAVGLGPTRAIVLAEAIFDTWTPGMVEVSYAHELKHYLQDNTWLPVALIAALSLAATGWVQFAGTRITRRTGHRNGVASLQAPGALPLIGLLMQAYLLAGVPAFHLTAQKRELDADRFALDLTHDKLSRGLVSASRCGDLWLPEDPLFDRLYLNTHPSMAKRVRLANEYQAPEAGIPTAR